MNIIKLDAIPSTNDYLKELLTFQQLENFSVVSAESQTQGKGQRGAVWVSQRGTNLTFSVLIKDLLFAVEDIFSLNIAVTLAIAKALERCNIPDVKIKWPNDILSGNKKIGGILIENVFKSHGAIYSIVGIGINVNQNDFVGFAQASSMAIVSGRVFDRETLLRDLVSSIVEYCQTLATGGVDQLWEAYHQYLFKIGVPMCFELPDSSRFTGVITAVSRVGALHVKTADDQVNAYQLKEIKLLY